MSLSILQMPFQSNLDGPRIQKIVRELAECTQLPASDQTRFATAISEVVRFLGRYAACGHVEFGLNQQSTQICLRVAFQIQEADGALIRLLDEGVGTISQTSPEFANIRRLVDALGAQKTPEAGNVLYLEKRLSLPASSITDATVAGWRQRLVGSLPSSPFPEIREQSQQLVRTLAVLQKPVQTSEPNNPAADAVTLSPTEVVAHHIEGILNAMGDAVVMFDAEERLQLVNQPFCRLFGLDAATIRGWSAQKVCAEMRPRFQEPERFSESEAAFCAHPQEVFEGITELSNPQRRMLYRFTAPVRNTEGQYIGRIVLYRDISRDLEIEQMKAEVFRLRADLETKHAFDQIIGSSTKMTQMYRLMHQAVEGNITVLIQGESGTGKELVAKALHFNGPRRSKPFVAVNCVAIPDTLIESELFGHERGAFTGAITRKAGRFELADGGTLLLDEIGEMPLLLQAKLLRVLQEREIQRVGGTTTIPVDVRVIAATNQDLTNAVQTRAFREDLFYRISAFPIRVPPLRERLDDIPLLVDHLIKRFSEENGRPIQHVSTRTLHALAAYHWPGNVRELENVIERAVLLERSDTLQIDSLPRHLLDSLKPEEHPSAQTPHVLHDVFDSDEILPMEEVEKQAILHALRVTQNNILQAAQALDINRATLYRKIKRYDILLGHGSS